MARQEEAPEWGMGAERLAAIVDAAREVEEAEEALSEARQALHRAIDGVLVLPAGETARAITAVRRGLLNRRPWWRWLF